MPNVINRMDHNESILSYISLVPNAKASVVKGAKQAAIIIALVALSSVIMPEFD